LKSFPGIDALAEADEKAIEEILSPLGLRWRIPAFKMMARDVREKYSASIPETRKELTSLPGVGDYVAGAVMTMAFGKKEWLVDSNIARIFSRYFGVITSGERRLDRRILEIARIYFSGKKPGRALMGILDISALICKPKKPLCERCPLKFKCIYKSIRKK